MINQYIVAMPAPRNLLRTSGPAPGHSMPPYPAGLVRTCVGTHPHLRPAAAPLPATVRRVSRGFEAPNRPVACSRAMDYRIARNPMMQSTDRTYPPMRFFVAAFWILVCLLSISAPILAWHAQYAPASFVYLLFSKVCHQMPERSFAIAGFPFAVCHRCCGIYLGLVAGSLIPISFRSPGMRRTWVAAATVPLAVDAALPLIGFGSNSVAGRFLTGFLFGTMLATIFVQGIQELACRTSRQQCICKGAIR